MKYSLYDFLVEYQNNEADLQAYLHGKTIENYNGSGSGDKYFGLEIGVFIAISRMKHISNIIYFLLIL